MLQWEQGLDLVTLLRVKSGLTLAGGLCWERDGRSVGRSVGVRVSIEHEAHAVGSRVGVVAMIGERFVEGTGRVSAGLWSLPSLATTDGMMSAFMTGEGLSWAPKTVCSAGSVWSGTSPTHDLHALNPHLLQW